MLLSAEFVTQQAVGMTHPHTKDVAVVAKLDRLQPETLTANQSAQFASK